MTVSGALGSGMQLLTSRIKVLEAAGRNRNWQRVFEENVIANACPRKFAQA